MPLSCRHAEQTEACSSAYTQNPSPSVAAMPPCRRRSHKNTYPHTHARIPLLTKQMCAQALWLRFVPSAAVADSSSWQMYKLGQPISPLKVMYNGSQAQHAVGVEGVCVLSHDHNELLSVR